MPDADSNQAAQDLLNMTLGDDSPTPEGESEVAPTEAPSEAPEEPTQIPTTEPTEAAVLPSATLEPTWTQTSQPSPTATVPSPPAVGGGTNDNFVVLQ